MEALLTRHMSVGKHSMIAVMDTKFDKIARKWGSRIDEITQKRTVAGLSTQAGSGESLLEPVSAGWALKIAQKRQVYSVNVKKRLVEEFLKGVDTGKKEDPGAVSKRLKASFPKSDWMSARQIAAYFSRLSVLQKSGRLNVQMNLLDDNEDAKAADDAQKRYQLRQRIIKDIDE
ncbi:hypothetical protein SNE40_000460 [Patella caerulea]|uniref:Uncharacterized protein n=1 Tax=Patella caerulea TaxID=87958 RepID=A0AAN8KDW9_PATCE